MSNVRGEVDGVKMLIFAGVLAIAALVIALGPSAPTADARGFGTQGSIGYFEGPPAAFLGDVDSRVKRCESRRLVMVLRKLPRRHRRNFRVVGRDRASSTGQWIIERHRFPRGRYFMFIPRKRFGPRGRHVCGKDRSSLLPIGY